MASNVSSALGTQRQFAPQPQGVYQKQLLVPSGDTTAGAGSKAARLANALGLMGDTLRGEISKQDARDKQWGLFKAEEIKKDPRTADKLFATTQQMLSATGNEALADNPYAMAQLDMWRGENAARDLRNRYHEQVVLKEGSCQTRAEEQERWMKFFNEHAKEYNISTDYLEANEKAQVDGDSTAPNSAAAIGTIKPISSFKNANSSKFFNMGLYDNFDTYTQREVDRQMTDAAENRKALRVGTMTARLSEWYSPENVAGKSADELKEGLYNIVVDAYKGGMQFKEAYPIIADAIDKYTANNGSANLKEIFDSVVAFSPDGQEFKLKDILPYEEYHGAGIAMDAARREKNMVDIMGKLSNAKTLDEYDKAVEDIKTNNPHEFSIMAQKNLLNSGRADLKQKIEYEKRQRMRGMSGATGKAVKSVLGDAFVERAKQVWRAFCNNSSWGAKAPITASLQVPVDDGNGNITYRNATEQEVQYAGQSIMGDILNDYANGNISLEAAVYQESKLLTMPQMKAFKQSFNTAVAGSLMDARDIDWDNAQYSDANVQNIQLACDIYNQNPAYANAIFNDSNMKAITGIVSLVDTADNISYHDTQNVSDGLKKAMKLYGNASNLLNDTTARQDIDSKYRNAISDWDTTTMRVDMMSVDGSGVPDVNGISFLGNPYLEDKVENLADIFIANGADGTTAVQLATDKIRGQVYQYNNMGYDVVIPKDMCVDINESPEWKGVAAGHAITALIYDVKEDKDDSVLVAYDHLNRQLVFTNSRTHNQKYVNADDLANEANYILDHPDEFDFGDNASHWVQDGEVPESETEDLTSAEYNERTVHE